MNAQGRQLALPFAHMPHYDAGDFIAAPANAAALAWLARSAAWPERRLLLWGEAGCGKTHLLHRWAAQAGALFLDGFALAWPHPAFRCGPVDRDLAIDDADGAGPVALLHVLNAAHEAGFRVVLCARAQPSRWPASLPDLDSRLRAMTIAQIAAPDDELRRLLLARLLAERQVAVPEPLQDWLLLHLPRDPQALREAAARLDRAGLASGGRVTRPLAAAVVDEIAAMWQPCG